MSVGRAADVLEAAARLRAHYGPLAWPNRVAPLENLIETILSQNTNDRNRDAAFRALRARYPDWQAVVEAPEAELAEVIRPAGLHRQKARTIQRVLRVLYEEHGAFSLDHLKSLSRDEALAALLRFRGVGKKTAGIVLTFSLGKPYFPVDTHIRRVTRRLGWVGPREDPHDIMNALVPEAWIYPLHLYLIRHGRETCRARRPACARCLLHDLCAYARSSRPDAGGERLSGTS